MSSDDDVLGDGDYSETGADEEAEDLTADIAGILAGRTVVPAGFMWWRSRRQRRAREAAISSGTAEGTRRPRWFEV